MSDPNWPPPGPPPYQSVAASSVVPGELAGWGARAGALVLDGAILLGFGILVGLIVAGLSGLDQGVIAGGIGFYAAAILYGPLTMMRAGEYNGQTLGKQAVGIRVIRETGEPMGFGWAMLREFVCKGVLSLFTLPLVLSYLWPLWDPRNQALHDKMVGTLVLRG